MTNAEKLQAAWSVLQSKAQIAAMLEEVEAQPDQISKAVAKLDDTGKQHTAKRRTAKIKNIAQQMQIAGISAEELIEYMEKHPKSRRKPRNAPSLASVSTAAA